MKTLLKMVKIEARTNGENDLLIALAESLRASQAASAVGGSLERTVARA